jgi:hypothetical protein
MTRSHTGQNFIRLYYPSAGFKADGRGAPSQDTLKSKNCTHMEGRRGAERDVGFTCPATRQVWWLHFRGEHVAIDAYPPPAGDPPVLDETPQLSICCAAVDFISVEQGGFMCRDFVNRLDWTFSAEDQRVYVNCGTPVSFVSAAVVEWVARAVGVSGEPLTASAPRATPAGRP